MKELAGLKHLTTVYLDKNPGTEAVVAELRQVLPNCGIHLQGGRPVNRP